MATTYDWGDSKVNEYYNQNIELLPTNTIDAPRVELPEQTRESIQDQIRGYLNPAYEKALAQLKKQRDYEREYAILDPNSRAASSEPNRNASESDWHKHYRRNLDVGETYARSALSNSYRSALAKTTAEQLENYYNRKLAVDTLNASLGLDTGIFNSNRLIDREADIYARAIESARRRGI